MKKLNYLVFRPKNPASSMLNFLHLHNGEKVG